MHRIRCSPFVRAFLLPFVLTCFLSACHKWSSVNQSPAVVLSEQAAMTVDDRDKLRLHLGPDASIEGTLSAMTQDSVYLGHDEAGLRVEIDQVVLVDVQKTDYVGIVALSLGIFAALYGISYAAERVYFRALF